MNQVDTERDYYKSKRTFRIAPESTKDRISIRLSKWTAERYRVCVALQKALMEANGEDAGWASEAMLKLALARTRPKLISLCVKAGVDPKEVLKGLESHKEAKPMPDLTRVNRVDAQ